MLCKEFDTMKKASIFAEIPEKLTEEFFEDIVRSENFRLERIVSRGHVTPNGEWFIQDHDEWVLVLRGTAALRFEKGNITVTLLPGDYILIPAHERHRVEWTAEYEETVWLALHYREVTRPQT